MLLTYVLIYVTVTKFWELIKIIIYFLKYFKLWVKLSDIENDGVMVSNGSKSSLIENVKSNQDIDPILIELKALITEDKDIENYTLLS